MCLSSSLPAVTDRTQIGRQLVLRHGGHCGHNHSACWLLGPRLWWGGVPQVSGTPSASDVGGAGVNLINGAAEDVWCAGQTETDG